MRHGHLACSQRFFSCEDCAVDNCGAILMIVLPVRDRFYPSSFESFTHNGPYTRSKFLGSQCRDFQLLAASSFSCTLHESAVADPATAVPLRKTARLVTVHRSK
jgi:hypothetical protein